MLFNPSPLGRPLEWAKRPDVARGVRKVQRCVTATTPAAKAQAFEDYLKAYPNSAVKSDVLNQLLYAYNQTGDEAKTLDAADRLLAVDPQNLRALTLEVYYRRADADEADRSRGEGCCAGQGWQPMRRPD